MKRYRRPSIYTRIKELDRMVNATFDTLCKLDVKDERHDALVLEWRSLISARNALERSLSS